MVLARQQKHAGAGHLSIISKDYLAPRTNPIMQSEKPGNPAQKFIHIKKKNGHKTAKQDDANV